MVTKLIPTFVPSWRSPRDLACAALAVVLGLGVGWLDLHVTEVVVTMVSLLSVGLVLGLLQPVAAWRWTFLIGIGLPITATVAILTGMRTAEPAHIDVLITLVALTFALVGSYAGVFVRRTARTQRSRSQAE